MIRRRAWKASRRLEHAVTKLGFVGAHTYPHWFELPPNDRKYYPFYTKCCELGVPIQMQVGQSLVYYKARPLRSVGRPIYLDDIACDFPELKIVGIHIGIPWHDEMIAMAWKHENIFIGSDAHSPKYWPASFLHYLKTYGRQKVMFGTRLSRARFRTDHEGDQRSRSRLRGRERVSARQCDTGLRSRIRRRKKSERLNHGIPEHGHRRSPCCH